MSAQPQVSQTAITDRMPAVRRGARVVDAKRFQSACQGCDDDAAEPGRGVTFGLLIGTALWLLAGILILAFCHHA